MMDTPPDNPDTMDRSDTPGRSDTSGMSDRSDMSDRSALSAAEAAAVLGVNERTVRRYIEKGKLRADRLETDRHTVELRINQAAIDDYRGRRGAVEHEMTSMDTSPDSLSDRPAPLSGGVSGPLSGPLSGRPVDMPALIGAISDRLDAQYQARLADKDELIGELRRRAEVAEREAAELRRTRRQAPWWLRLLVGGR